MQNKDINYNEYKEDEFTSDLREAPVLSFDEELMDNFDESLLEEEEAIIDFVEEENKKEDSIQYSGIDITKVDKLNAKEHILEDELFYNFRYINKKKSSAKKNENKIIQDKKKYGFLKLEDLPIEKYATAKSKEKDIEKEISNINKEGFYFFNYEQDTNNDNQNGSTNNDSTKTKENENIENIVLSKESVNIDDMLVKDEETKKYIENQEQYKEKYKEKYKEEVLDNQNINGEKEEIEEIEERENHTKKEENNQLDNIITVEEKQQDRTEEKSLKKIASSIKYAGLYSYEDYKKNKIQNKGIKELVKYINVLLKELPDDKKKLFINSEEHKLYNKIQERLGIKVEL